MASGECRVRTTSHGGTKKDEKFLTGFTEWGMDEKIGSKFNV
jgi:hypothetical protein